MKKRNYKRYYASIDKKPFDMDSCLISFKGTVHAALKACMDYYGEHVVEEMKVYEIDIRPVKRFRGKLFLEEK
jgi:hypothetical protein